MILLDLVSQEPCKHRFWSAIWIKERRPIRLSWTLGNATVNQLMTLQEITRTSSKYARQLGNLLLTMSQIYWLPSVPVVPKGWFTRTTIKHKHKRKHEHKDINVQARCFSSIGLDIIQYNNTTIQYIYSLSVDKNFLFSCACVVQIHAYVFFCVLPVWEGDGTKMGKNWKRANDRDNSDKRPETRATSFNEHAPRQ